MFVSIKRFVAQSNRARSQSVSLDSIYVHVFQLKHVKEKKKPAFPFHNLVFQHDTMCTDGNMSRKYESEIDCERFETFKLDPVPSNIIL